MPIALSHLLFHPLSAACPGMVVGALVCRCAERGAQGALAAPSGRRRIVCAALGGASCAALATAYGPRAETVELTAFAAILLYLSLTDLDRFVIPNAGIAAAVLVRVAYLCASCVRGDMTPAAAGFYMVSALGVGLALLVTVLLADRLLGMDSMGGGDLKLFAVAALYVGWQQSVVLVMLSCLLGLASSQAFQRRLPAEVRDTPAGMTTFPFGPAIAAATIVTLLCGEAVVRWYLGLLVGGV